MGLATTGGAEVEGESQVKKSRRAIGTGGRLAGLRLRLRLRLAGWLLYSIFIGVVDSGQPWGPHWCEELIKDNCGSGLL